MRRGVYQGWTGWRNLGDEAMFEACRRAMPNVAWTARPPFDARHATRGRVLRSCRDRVVDYLAHSPAVLGGGTLINRAPEWLDEYRRLRRSARRPVPVLSPGVANPEYWSRTPGWRDTRREWREALVELPEVGVRGPLSKRLLDEAGVANVRVTGDPALIFHRARAANGATRRIAINAGRSGGEVWGSEDRLIEALADAARRLASRGFDVRLFPVWDRDERVCREVATSAGLGGDAVDALVLDADACVDYLATFDVVVSVKLHAAVLAAAAGVPFVAIEYRPKVRDFAESVGCVAQTFRSSDVDGSMLARAVLGLHDDVPVARERLTARVAELSQAFAAYARRIEELVLA
jgi:polysaccharide pyruvyl transferase WcaK-like protein